MPFNTSGSSRGRGDNFLPFATFMLFNLLCDCTQTPLLHLINITNFNIYVCILQWHAIYIFYLVSTSCKSGFLYYYTKKNV